MGIKYKLKLKDLKLEYLVEYFKPILKFFKPKEKINNYEDLKNYIQKKSAFVRMVLAINTKRSFLVAFCSKVHFVAPLIEPGLSVAYSFRPNTGFRCFLIFIHSFFSPWQLSVFLLVYASQAPF